MSDALSDQLTSYLTDAHSIEEQSLQQLRNVPEDVPDELIHAMREHLAETENHESRTSDLLQQRDASPSKIKDVVMKAGGQGFVWFAESQPDTAGKLAAHALSYEALEWASYDLLARTADRAGEASVAEAARDIRDDERAMMSRLESLFDRTTRASLDQVGRDDLQSHLESYLADAHALEAQSIQLLQGGKELADDAPTLAALFEEHLEESRAQQQRIETRLDALDGSPSLLKDAALRLGALNWSTFFLGHPDTAGKLAAFAYAFEHLEIGGYEQLQHVAHEAGDHATVETAAAILEEERNTADRIAALFDEAVDAALGEQGIG